MRVSLINSNLETAEIERISNLLNCLQLFFCGNVHPAQLQLPKGSISPLSFEAIDKAMKPLLVSNSDLNILLTHRNVMETEAVGFCEAGTCFVVSDHHTNHENRSAALWFVRRILNIAMVRLRLASCELGSCVCSLGGACISLCQTCEQYFKNSGYRDAIRSLKDALNWLNLRSAESNPSLPPQFLIPSGRLRLAEIYVADYKRRNSAPLKDKTIYMVLHFLSDLVPFVRSLHEFGAAYSDMLLIAKSYPYATRDQVGHQLELLGVRVLRASPYNPIANIAQHVLEEAVNSKQIPSKLLIIEDGGYFAPIIHRKCFAGIAKKCIGIVEQTTKGIAEDKKKITKPLCPILSVAECEFKAEYEAPEIGRITVQNISRFVPNVKLSGRHAVLFGFGSVGEYVATHLNRSFNMGVSVVDPVARKLLKARHRKDIVIEAQATFGELSIGRDSIALVVGTTGNTTSPTLSKQILEAVPDGTIFVSTSSDRVEIDMKWLESLPASQIREVEEGKTEYSLSQAGGKGTVTVLAEGYPINFYGSASLPNDTIDPIMTLLLLCGLEIVEKPRMKNGFHVGLVNTLVKDRKLIEHFVDMT